MKAKARGLKLVLMGPSLLLDLLSCGLLPVSVMVDVAADATLLVSNKGRPAQILALEKGILGDGKRFCLLALEFVDQVIALDGIGCGEAGPKRVLAFIVLQGPGINFHGDAMIDQQLAFMGCDGEPGPVLLPSERIPCVETGRTAPWAGTRPP